MFQCCLVENKLKEIITYIQSRNKTLLVRDVLASPQDESKIQTTKLKYAAILHAAAFKLTCVQNSCFQDMTWQC